jgi:hypothetical protein
VPIVKTVVTNTELTKTLPPILLGFGGLIPILVIFGQGTLSKADRALGSTIFVLVTWIAYLVTGFLWGIWFYDFFVILGLLVLATVMLIVVCVARTNRTTESNSSNLGAAFVFLAAISVLAFASAVYVGPSGHDVVHLRGDRNGDLRGVEGLFKGEQNMRALQFVTRFGSTSIVLSKDQFKDLETLTLTYKDGKKSGVLPVTDAVPMLGPYLGNHYILKTQPSN